MKFQISLSMAFIAGSCDSFHQTTLPLFSSPSHTCFRKIDSKRTKTVLFLDGKGMASGLINKHLIGDAIRALQPRYLNQAMDSIKDNLFGDVIEFDFDESLGKNRAISWSELSLMLESKSTPKEKVFREELHKGKVHNLLTSKRVFSSRKSNLDKEVKLYRDSSSWCPYCQKIIIALEEKEIPYEVIKVDMNCYAGEAKSAEFLKIQPNGNLPCVVIDGTTVISESNDILDALDTISPSSNLLRPEGKEEEIRYLCDDGRNSLERRLYAEFMWFLTGVRKPQEYFERYESVLYEIETYLSENKQTFFLSSKHPTLPDIQFIPFLERQAASLAYFKGYKVRDPQKFPNLCKWFDAMERLSSYQNTKSDYYTHAKALPPQLSADCFMDYSTTSSSPSDYNKDTIEAHSLPLLKRNGNSFEIIRPSKESLSWIEPGWEHIPSKQARREAAERIINNHKNLVRFTCRGAGTKGFPAAAATLSDPLAKPNLSLIDVMDIFLRHVVQFLLMDEKVKANQKEEMIEDTIQCLFNSVSIDDETGNVKKLSLILAIVSCLDYLRERIGVPRDMSYPAATQMKKEIRFVSEVLLSHLDDETVSFSEVKTLEMS